MSQPRWKLTFPGQLHFFSGEVHFHSREYICPGWGRRLSVLYHKTVEEWNQGALKQECFYISSRPFVSAIIFSFPLCTTRLRNHHHSSERNHNFQFSAQRQHCTSGAGHRTLLTVGFIVRRRCLGLMRNGIHPRRRHRRWLFSLSQAARCKDQDAFTWLGSVLQGYGKKAFASPG